MSHISASEKPAPGGGAVDRRDHRIGDAPEVDDRLVQDLGAAAHVGGQVRRSDSSSPRLNQVTSPPAENARPAPVTISARSGARSASQAAAVTSSPIISGLIALRASGRSRVRVPISPSISMLHRLQLGRAAGRSAVVIAAPVVGVQS